MRRLKIKYIIIIILLVDSFICLCPACSPILKGQKVMPCDAFTDTKSVQIDNDEPWRMCLPPSFISLVGCAATDSALYRMRTDKDIDTTPSFVLRWRYCVQQESLHPVRRPDVYLYTNGWTKHSYFVCVSQSFI